MTTLVESEFGSVAESYDRLVSDYKTSYQLTENWTLYEQIRKTKWLTTCNNFEIKLKIIEEWLTKYEEKLLLKEQLDDSFSEKLRLQTKAWDEEKENWQKEKSQLLTQMQDLQVNMRDEAFFVGGQDLTCQRLINYGQLLEANTTNCYATYIIIYHIP